MSQRTMTEAKCTECGQVTTVPFKPTPGKPVYCKACFAKRNNPTGQTATTNRNYEFDPKQVWARRR